VHFVGLFFSSITLFRFTGIHDTPPHIVTCEQWRCTVGWRPCSRTQCHSEEGLQKAKHGPKLCVLINFTFFEPYFVIYVCNKNQQNAQFYQFNSAILSSTCFEHPSVHP